MWITPGTEMPGIDAYIEPTDISGDNYLFDFLTSPEFRVPELAKITGLPQSRGRLELLSAAQRMVGQFGFEVRVLRAIVERERQWLAFATGSVQKCPNKGAAVELLRGNPKPGWYGPIWSEERHHAWYIRYHRVPHYQREDEPNEDGDDEASVRLVHARWFIVAEYPVTDAR
ncbi:MAG: hypothetical protein KC621_23490, partial [Myxococcales bacterium]|nr:hypothetical protein [Myxococcales bacterium]